MSVSWQVSPFSPIELLAHSGKKPTRFAPGSSVMARPPPIVSISWLARCCFARR